MANYRIYADIKELFVGGKTLTLKEEAAAGQAVLTVHNTNGVAVNNIVCLREPGSPRAEILATHASTVPTSSTVTLASNLDHTHPAGTIVYILKADQVEFFHAATQVDANDDDSALTSLASAQDIDPTLIRNFYDDTTKSAGYYYYQFQDSVNTKDLVYSDGIAWNQHEVTYADDEVGAILEDVRSDMGREWNDRYDKRKAIKDINECLRDIQGELKRWSRYYVPNYSLGNTSLGSFSFTMPTDIYDKYTQKSIIEVKLKGIDRPLEYTDDKDFTKKMKGVKFTTVRTEASSGDTTLEIDNSYDFAEEGSVTVFISGTAYTLEYDDVTRSSTAGVLTGIPASGDGAITVTIPVGTYVWQGHATGEPQFYNVDAGTLYIYPLPSSSFSNHNLLMTYNREATKVDSEGDTIDAERFDMVKHYLTWKARAAWKNEGELDLNDSDLLLYKDMLSKAKRNHVKKQRSRLQPKLNRTRYFTRRNE